MSSMKDLLRKAANLVVELPPEQPESLETFPGGIPMTNRTVDPAPIPDPVPIAAAPAPVVPTVTKSVEQIVRESHGPDLDQINAKVVQPNPLPAAPGGQVNFADIYQRENLPAAAFTADQALDMLHSLPADLPLETKRQTFQVMLNAMGKSMGVTIETIVADASRKLAAITTYAEDLSSHTNEYVKSTEAQIAQMEADIERKKRDIEQTRGLLDSAVKSCQAESDRLDDILEFFSMDVPPSKYAGSNPPQ